MTSGKTYQYDSCNPGRYTIEDLVPNVATSGLEQDNGDRGGEDREMNNMDTINHPEKGTKSHAHADGCLFNDWCGPIVRIKTSHNSGESESESVPMVSNCFIKTLSLPFFKPITIEKHFVFRKEGLERDHDSCEIEK